MKITTWNVNGLRAALRKGFPEHIARIDPDVLLLQEVRALPEQLPELWINPAGYHVAWHPAVRKGYAGTAIWSKRPMRQVTRGMGASDRDDEGRVLSASVDGVRVTSVYLPKGDADTPKQARKEAWMRRFRRWLGAQANAATPAVVGGDLNIAHTARDLYYAKANEQTSGFLPGERDWMTRLLASGWADLQRDHAGDVDGPYSWWSNRGQARQLDRGWRIDYLLGNAAAAARVVAVATDRAAGLACSDHAPVTAELR